MEERFLFRRVEAKELNVFQCVARYGYNDVQNEQEPFEKVLVERLKEFIVKEFWMTQNMLPSIEGEEGESEVKKGIEREISIIEEASKAGVVHLIGENEAIAGNGASIWDRILIDYAYNFLNRNVRQSDKVFEIPHKHMIKVGMKYEL